jgi:NAD(P)-dependent dehydrogenase (short-subunit alcohol dehydrogenase family)
MTRGAVLITGASTGIGAATAVHLAHHGHQVFGGVRKEADGERLQARASGITPLILDVTDQGQIDAAAKTIGDAVGHRGLAGLVNNAGIGRGGPIEYLSQDDWRLQFDVNVLGQVAVTRTMLPLIRTASGRIVLVGSIGGRLSSPFIAPYNSSKFALAAIADSLRGELHMFGIKVALIEPGAVKTDIWEKGRQRADELTTELPPEALERYGDVITTARKLIDFQDRTGIEPIVVAKAIEHALTSARPKPRYLVGKDAKAQALVARFMPMRVRDALVRRVLKI